MKIGELAERSRVPAKTIRFWEERGLMPAPVRTLSGYRAYEATAVERLLFIRSAQAAGFTLDEIRRVLDIADSGRPPCEHVGDLIDGRLAAIETRIAELEIARRQLQGLAERARQQDPAECRGYCAILAETA